MHLEYLITPLDTPETRVAVQDISALLSQTRTRLYKENKIGTQFIRMHPTHRNQFLFIDENNRQQFEGHMHNDRPHVDALITSLPNLALECDPADCGVYILFSKQYELLSLVHAGKQGSILRILEKTVKKGAQLLDVPLNDYVADLTVYVAPAICGKHYQLKHVEFPKQDFVLWQGHILGKYNVHEKEDVVHIVAQDHTFGFDFMGFNYQRLLKLGIAPEQIHASPICTYELLEYPSHRRAKEQRTPDSRFMVLAVMR
jgi:YfiH family protein